jgi:hypothetical protein
MLAIETVDGDVLCHRSTAWRCFPPIKEPLLGEAEPAVPPQDKRLKEYALETQRAALECASAEACTLLVERSWARDRIAHTYFWGGSFITAYRLVDGRMAPAGQLRTRIRASDNSGRRFLGDLTWQPSGRSCVELRVAPRLTNLWPDSELKPPPRGPYEMPSPGTYCLGPSGFSRVAP